MKLTTNRNFTKGDYYEENPLNNCDSICFNSRFSHMVFYANYFFKQC